MQLRQEILALSEAHPRYGYRRIIALMRRAGQGATWEQAYIESFHGKLRDELLNRELFGNLHEARVVLEAWRCVYNHERPHSSLDTTIEVHQFKTWCSSFSTWRVPTASPPFPANSKAPIPHPPSALAIWSADIASADFPVAPLPPSSP